MELCLETRNFRESLRRRDAGKSPEEILTTAVGRGIRCFDAAGAYDEAEKILGNFLRYQKRKADFIITTKIRPNTLRRVSPTNYAGAVRQSLVGSLKNLGLDHVSACLFHNADSLGDAQALQALYALREEGLTDKVGVCVSTPEEFEEASSSPYIGVIQISYNVFDTRLDHLLKKTDKEIQAGGVFLNGLLFRGEEDVPDNMWEAKSYLHALTNYEERHGVTRAELAITFAKTQTQINQLIIDVENAEQLVEDCDCFMRPGDVDALRELPDQLGGLDEKILRPSLWRGEYR